MDAVRLEVGGEAVAVPGGSVRHAVVANHGSRESQELAGVRGVGQGLRVPNHAGGKDDLARGRGVRAEGSAGKAEVVEDKGGGTLRVGVRDRVVGCRAEESPGG